MTSGTTETLNGVYFLDMSTGYTWGTNNTYLITIDGGANWVEQVAPNKISSEDTDTISDIAFDDTGEPLYAVGGAEGKDRIWEYDGSTWDQISTSEPDTDTLLTKISVNVEGTDWYVVGEDDDNSGDGTPSWRKPNNASWDSINVSYSVFGNNYCVGFTVLQNVWVAGENGIFYSYNLGLDWNHQYQETEIRDIRMLDMSGTPIGWAVGREGVILKYDTQWNHQETQSSDLYGVHLINDSDGAIVGANGLILITNDGGD